MPMAKKIPKYSVAVYRAILEESKEPRTVAAVLVLAMAQWKQKDLNNVNFATVLDMCSDHVKKNM